MKARARLWTALAVAVLLAVALIVVVRRHQTTSTPAAASSNVVAGESVDSDDADASTDETGTTTALSTASAATSSNRPDPALTPGAVFPNVTASQVCVAGYSKSVRNVPQSKKDMVFSEYGITSHPSGAYEVDHLISLELGGSNEVTNLWPEPYAGPDNAHVKDGLENRFHSMVCAGTMTLSEAQADIVHWWDFE